MQPNVRYSCQVVLPGFGAKAQKRLAKAKVLLVGVGGLGCPAAQYLVAAGIGNLTLADFDTISAQNLHRQILFSPKDVGQPKAEVARAKLQQQNPLVKVTALPVRLTSSNIAKIIKPYDLVLDCTDNFEARYLLSDACVLAGLPLVYGAAYQFQGQVAVWNAPTSSDKRGPHYRDMFPEGQAATALDCSTGGVTPTLTGIIGTMQANEAIKYLADLPGLLAGKLLVFDAQTMHSYTIALPPVSKTPVTQLPKKDESVVQTIKVADLKATLGDNQYQLIDVRSQPEHASFNIGGQNIPLIELLSSKIRVKTGRPIVFYCNSGNKSAVASKYVQSKNPGAHVYSLEGGMKAWQEAQTI